mgnify:CR=1 FL=1
MLRTSASANRTLPPPGLTVRSEVPPAVSVPAAVKSRELMSRAVASIVMLPASPPSSIVIAPVVEETSNS